jgi:hypothetical protein
MAATKKLYPSAIARQKLVEGPAHLGHGASAHPNYYLFELLKEYGV